MTKTCLCLDCKAVVPEIDGPTHSYIGANAGCWQLYGEVLEKEYRDPAYMRVHRLTVDAYAAQHPGKNEARSAQSVNVHLAALYLIFERKQSFDFATKSLGRLIARKNHQFEWLVPPDHLGEMTVADVHGALSADDHAQKVEKWARSVWGAWSPHRHSIERLFVE